MNKLIASGLILLLSACIIVITGMRIASNKVIWSGDETISYLSATGNQEHFNTVAKQTEGSTLNASLWRNLVSIDEPYCFKKISKELAITDLHPPLFFWLLHLYIMVFGFSLGAGITLNLLLHLLSLATLFILARKLSFSPLAAATICLLWTVSPAALSVGFYARQYVLFGLIHLLYAVSFVSWIKHPGRTNILLLVIFCTLGLLSHYSFSYTVAGYFLFALLHLNTLGRNHIVAFATTFIVSVLLLSLIHPHFLNQLALQQQRAQPFEPIHLLARIGKTFLTFSNFFAPLLLLKPWVINIPPKLLLLISGVIVGTLGIYGWLNRIKINAFIAVIKTYPISNINLPGFLFIWIGLVFIAPFLLFITPLQSMGAQYLVCIYPVMAILTYQLIQQSRVLQFVFILIMLAGSTLSVQLFVSKQQSFTPLCKQVKEANFIICDQVDRRNIGRLLPYFESAKTITILGDADSKPTAAMQHSALLLISAYEKPGSIIPGGQYYDFEDWGGFIAVKKK